MSAFIIIIIIITSDSPPTPIIYQKALRHKTTKTESNWHNTVFNRHPAFCSDVQMKHI